MAGTRSRQPLSGLSMQGNTAVWSSPQERISQFFFKPAENSWLSFWSKKNPALQGLFWPELESNQRHKDFQSSALPTELSGHRNKARKFKRIKSLGIFCNHFVNFSGKAVLQLPLMDKRLGRLAGVEAMQMSLVLAHLHLKRDLLTDGLGDRGLGLDDDHVFEDVDSLVHLEVVSSPVLLDRWAEPVGSLGFQGA